jgi:hypothetical protein
MGLLKKIFGGSKDSLCPGCGRQIQDLAESGHFIVRQVDVDTGKVRMGVKCRSCGTLHHHLCASDSEDLISRTCMKCGARDFTEVPIEIRGWNK